MTSSMMRPGNFRHDTRGPRVVEVSMAEYLRSKRTILKKIRRRLIILGIIIGLTSVLSLGLGVTVHTYLKRMVKFKRTTLFGVRLDHLFFHYGGVSLLFSLHGFNIDGKWRKMQQDGNRLVMHLRIYSILGFISWWLAVWLGYGMLDIFGLIDIRNITDSSSNLVYLVTLVLVCVHLVVAPWLLRTIHRKASQADEYFGAEFMDEIKRSRKQGSNSRDQDDDAEADDDDDDQANVEDVAPEYDDDDDDEEEEEEERRDRRAVVVPASSPRGHRNRPGSSISSARAPPSPTRNRRAFYNADGTSTVVSATSPTARTHVSPRSPRRSVSSPRSKKHVDDEVDAVVPPSTLIPEGLHTASTVTNPDQIPFASPVFVMDPQAQLTPSDFWRLWKQVETTGSFSCLFKNHPRRQDVEAHLQAFGFHVVAIEVKDNVLQCYFYAHQYGTDTCFLCEFVFIYSRRFFQATFKCKDRDAASDFVTRFNLQDLLVVDE